MIAVIGSGFGLYGYLPALVGCGQSVLLSERYRARFLARTELARFASSVHWCDDEDSALDHADGVVLAKRPEDQPGLVARCLERAGIQRLLLEKPLAPDPDAAGRLLEILMDSGRVFRVGYTFRYTDWARRLLAQLAQRPDGALYLEWDFCAHHFRHGLDNWKRFDSRGGGALRFYGIQAIALLAELGYRSVVESERFGSSKDEIEKWKAIVAGPDLPDCHVNVHSRSVRTAFRVAWRSSNQEVVFADQGDPFDVPGQQTDTGGDRRVALLMDLVQSLWTGESEPYAWYNGANALWGRVECRARSERRDPH